MFYFFFSRKAPRWIKAIRGLLFCSLVWFFCGLFGPVSTVPGTPSLQAVDPIRLRGHVDKLAVEFAPRSYERVWNLNKSADYISNEFRAAGGTVSEQTYEVKGKIYRNVMAHFGPESDSRIVVGAHYDSFQDTPGADDNASGVAGLIELAHLFGKSDLPKRVELVAFTLEEPPFFRTGNMGSARHAYRLRKAGVEVDLMVCLEMIGYFRDEPGSQLFPSQLLQKMYPDIGNYIGVIGSFGERKEAHQFKASMAGATDLPVEVMCAPKDFPGVDFSDHRNYWANDYKAIMITDTAFMRNGHYHGSGDTPETLDYERMAKVVLGVYEAVLQISR
jgi:Zn-dependent M28 family amino/carboxypeptidase